MKHLCDKNIFIVLLVTTIICNFSVNSFSQQAKKKTEKMLTGSWDLVSMNMGSLGNLVDSLKINVPGKTDSLKKAASASIDSFSKKLENMRGTMMLSLNRNHSFTAKKKNKTDKGKWELSNDGKTLTTISEEPLKKSFLEINKITKDSLIFLNKESDTHFYMIFVRV